MPLGRNLSVPELCVASRRFDAAVMREREEEKEQHEARGWDRAARKAKLRKAFLPNREMHLPLTLGEKR